MVGHEAVFKHKILRGPSIVRVSVVVAANHARQGLGRVQTSGAFISCGRARVGLGIEICDLLGVVSQLEINAEGLG